MKKYIIFEEKEKRSNAGAKAPSDIFLICKQMDYKEFLMPRLPNTKNKAYQKAWLLCSGLYHWIKLLNTIEENSIVVYQHPMYGNRLVEKMVPLLQKKRGTKFIVIIHDLESLRGGIAGVVERSAKTNDIADNALLKKFDAIICHNEHMRQYLISQGFYAKKIVNLEIFDYLTGAKATAQQKKGSPAVAVAGTLAIGKCAYIYKMFDNGNNPGLTLNLYGLFYQEDEANPNMVYHGAFKPDELPGILEGDFGLVWDGNSAETCAGNTGRYLRYNNPHKTSLYLAAGMPVIVWSQAAIADFVRKMGVGITVDSLYELEDTILSISPEEYAAMCEKAGEISEKLRSGYYFMHALEAAERIVSGESA